MYHWSECLLSRFIINDYCVSSPKSESSVAPAAQGVELSSQWSDSNLQTFRPAPPRAVTHGPTIFSHNAIVQLSISEREMHPRTFSFQEGS